MSDTNPKSADYQDVRNRRHPDCWVCAPNSGPGLDPGFEADPNGSVEGSFPCSPEFTGYPGFLHGGVTSSLLDGAMTNCLMAHGKPGLTARLEVRFLNPVLIGKTAVIRAWLEKTRGSLSVLGAELSQDGEVLATATGKFMDYPEDAEA